MLSSMDARNAEHLRLILLLRGGFGAQRAVERTRVGKRRCGVFRSRWISILSLFVILPSRKAAANCTKGDPYYNLQLTLTGFDFSLRS